MVKHNQAIIAYRRFKLTGELSQLKTAINLYKVALQSRTEERSRVGWAETQYMLGYALVDLGVYTFDEAQVNDAVNAFHNAATVFDASNYPNRAAELADRIGRLPKLREVVRKASSCLKNSRGSAAPASCQYLLSKQPVP
jgi:hypothetical protein